MSRLEKIKLIRLIVALGLVFSYFYNYLLNGFFLRRDYPFNTFLPPPSWDFADFLFHTYITRDLSPYLDTGVALKSNFPPFIHLLIWPFTLLDPVYALIIFSALFAGFCGWLGWRHLKGDSPVETFFNTCAIIFASYPFMFAVARGNYEIYVFILVYFGVMTFPAWRSAVLLGVAAACKIFPGTLALIFIDRKNYPKFFFTVLVSLLLTVIGFFAFKGGFAANVSGFRHMMQVYHQHYVLNASGLAFCHSFYGLLLVSVGTSSSWMAGIYFKLAIILGAGISLLVVFESALWKKVTLTIVLMTLLPHVSGDYKLLHFLIPLFLFLDASPEPSDSIFCWLFGLLLIPKAWVFFEGDVSSATVLNPVLICGILLVIAKNHLVSVKNWLTTRKIL